MNTPPPTDGTGAGSETPSGSPPDDGSARRRRRRRGRRGKGQGGRSSGNEATAQPSAQSGEQPQTQPAERASAQPTDRASNAEASSPEPRKRKRRRGGRAASAARARAKAAALAADNQPSIESAPALTPQKPARKSSRRGRGARGRSKVKTADAITRVAAATDATAAPEAAAAPANTAIRAPSQAAEHHKGTPADEQARAEALAARRARAERETSAGGIVYRVQNGQALFLLIRDSYHNWGFPKGHLEAGEGPDEAAVREVQEETGLAELQLDGAIETIDWFFRFRGKLVHKVCHFYLMRTENTRTKPQREEGITACRWARFEDATRLISYANARAVLTRANDMVLASHVATGAGE